jgi:hypothetical protein
MTFLAVKLFIGDVFAFLAKHRWAFTILLCGIVAVGGAVFLRGCYVDHKQGQVRTELNADNSQINQSNDNSGIIESEKNKRENEVKDAGKQTNKAVDAVNRAKSNDSSNANTDPGAVLKRFCATYPTDSRCANVIPNAQ